MDSNRDLLRQMNDELEAEKRHDALRRVRLYRWARRRLAHAADFGRDMIIDYWWMILGSILFYGILALGDRSPAWVIVGPLGTIGLAGIYTWYDRKLRAAERRIRDRDWLIDALRESSLDLEATVQMLLGDQARVAAVGERPGVWVGQTWYEIEEDDR